jgi:hypothetical protein
MFDLKLDSLVWDSVTETVLLIDFNGAVWSDEQQRWTVAAFTPRFSAPEVEVRAVDTDHRADIFSLGVVFLALAVRVSSSPAIVWNLSGTDMLGRRDTTMQQTGCSGARRAPRRPCFSESAQTVHAHVGPVLILVGCFSVQYEDTSG